MSQSGHSSRNYQIEELTRGVKFPLAGLKPRHLKIIAEFLVQAWQGLLATQEPLVHMQEEIEINALMESRLLGLLHEGREWSTLASSVVRGKESLSHDGSSLEKRPDLSMCLTKKDPRFPLIIECKLMDKKASRKSRCMETRALPGS